MPAAIECPHCGSRSRLDDRSAGKIIDCPKCQASFKVPGVATAKLIAEPAADSLESIGWSDKADLLPSQAARRQSRPVGGSRRDAGIAAVLSALWPGFRHLPPLFAYSVTL